MDILDKPGLLSWKIVKLRNYNETKKNVDEIMYKVEEYRYTLSKIQPPRITPLYEIKYDFQKEYNNISKTEQYVTKIIDLEIEADNLYQKLTLALNQMCREELIYFKNSYYNHLAEESICDLLNMSRDSLRRIKESCIIKIAMVFNVDVIATR